MENNRTLVMTFADDEGHKVSVTINKPAASLEAATVSAQMDALITSQVIAERETGSFNPVTQKVSAKFVTQTKTAVTVG